MLFRSLELTVVARDASPGAKERPGRSEPFRFEIVTAEELLSRLAVRELNLRQRFEQTVREIQGVRRSLEELRSAPGPADRLAVEAQWIQLRKNANETGGVGLEFRAVLQEMIHNRVTTTRLLERIEQGVVLPLEQASTEEFPDADRRLERLREQIDGPDRAAALDQSLASVDRVLARCDAILKGMLKLESFNEVVTMLRSILTEQQGLNEKTRQQRRKQVMELLK